MSNFPIKLKQILEKYGKHLIAEERLVHFLSDYHSFDEKWKKRIMEVFLQRGCGKNFSKFCEQAHNGNSLKLQQIRQRLYEEGFEKQRVDYMVDSIRYALGYEQRLPVDIAKNQSKTKPKNHSMNVETNPFMMVYVDGGTFMMGATQEQGICPFPDEKPAVKVELESFYLAEIPVTQSLWEVIMGDNPSHFTGSNLPVERVTWNHCQEFIAKLRQKTLIEFRLPTEAEWEYAARGGLLSKRCKYAGTNDDDVDDFIWFKDNSQSKTHDVKSKRPNELGLYDMCGNVSEWCSDWYARQYYNISEQNPQGPIEGILKVYRGGSWNDKISNCRVSKRFSMNPGYKNKQVGLRLAATII